VLEEFLRMGGLSSASKEEQSHLVGAWTFLAGLLGEFRDDKMRVEEFHGLVQEVREILAARESPGDVVRGRFMECIARIKQEYLVNSVDEWMHVAVNGLVSNASSWESNLFVTYDHDLIPATNNDTEQFINILKAWFRRTSGFKAGNISFLNRAGEIAFVDFRASLSIITRVLLMCPYHEVNENIKLVKAQRRRRSRWRRSFRKWDGIFARFKAEALKCLT